MRDESAHDLGSLAEGTALELDEARRRVLIDLKASIEAALGRLGSIDPRRIHVTVGEEGDIRLEGTVRSWSERADAERAARSTAGVDWIDNRLNIE